MGELHNTYIGSACNYIAHALNTFGELMDRHTTSTRTLIVIATIIALSGAASATDYYVATWGDNTTQGNITHPWQNVSYAAQQATAGDTVYLFDGTWYNEIVTVINSGNATHPITFTAYNGTPTIDNVVGDPNTDWGFYIADVDYINVSDITFTRCWYAIYIRRSNNTHIINCTAYTYALVSATGKGFYINDDSHYCSIENCTVIGDAHNSYAVSGRYYDSGVWHCGECTYNTIKNCAAYNNTAHGFYDLAGNQSHTVVDNNVGYNNTGTCLYVHVGVLHDITITNNTFYDASTGITGTSVASPTSRIHNSTIKDNLIYDCAEGIKFYESDSMVVDNNTIHNMSAGTGVMLWGYNNTFTDNHVYDILSGSYYHYRTGPGLNGGSGNIIRNEINKTPRIYSAASTETVVEYTDGTVFTNNGAGSPRWYQDRSNYAVENAIITTITSHNITLRPTYGHLSDVTVDTWDEATDTYRITASSMQRDNPTWVNLTTKAAYTTYDITRDGEPCTPATTGADGVLRYYTDEWDGPQTFEFSYASDGAVPAPLVTNLRNDTPTQQTVTLRWDCSTPDMDYYTIYQNGALLNTTGNKYYSATDLSPDTTYIFSVSATKDGITDDSVSIIVRTAAEDNLPTARAGSDQTVNVNSSVTLDGSASTGDGITSHVWDFDSRNGIQQDATGAIVSHIYTGPDIHRNTHGHRYLRTNRFG
jgi:parallel beta-helix repeat protein